ncbi:U3 small nucleolar RNA-associated 18-like protein [Micractinium conductrix]|uniref:U3 small nucleolar RNA-associated 18-like protein n=1 Tax=Micractinium conductrix TaxID=554055 RepID=A0A2P6V5N9_9CHLO|nr:U3 small nucleolar RNA-associated 18-like protein [Micractinium conductrix]|eukprot:PSC69396.1 U3 small nucleolar RNA-associated 18-like protein [Micractinium conductrix]
MAAPKAPKRQRLVQDVVDREAELEGLLFGRDEEALQQLGHEVGGGGADGGASLADFLSSYRVGAAAAAAREDEEDDEEAAAAEVAAGGLGLFEDRQGGDAQQQRGAQQRRRPVWEDPQDVALRIDVAQHSQLRKLRRDEAETELTGHQYEARLRQQHNKLHPRTAWASLKKAERRRRRVAEGGASDSEDEEGGAEAAAERLLQRAGGLLARGAALPPTMLETTRLKDANQADPCKGAVKSVDWHVGGDLLLSAGLDRRVRLFSVDGVKNPHVASWFLEDMPVHKAAFTAGGSKVVLTGRRRFFYLLDVESQAVDRLASLHLWREEKSFESFVTSQHSPQPMAAFFGNEGHVPLVSLHTKQMVGTLKMSGTARSGAFSADGTQLLTSGGDGTVYVWDLRTQRCLQRYQDEGCLKSTALACSPEGTLFAAASSSGVVNLYSRSQQEEQEQLRRHAAAAAPPRPARQQRITFEDEDEEGEDEEEGRQQQQHRGGWTLPEAPIAGKPVKSVTNLTTSVDTLAFNHDGQMLVMASRLKRDSLKLLHVPSMTVFSNWPTSKSPVHYVHAAAFSPHSGYLAVGNARGRVLLYRLHHYAKA